MVLVPSGDEDQGSASQESQVWPAPCQPPPHHPWGTVLGLAGGHRYVMGCSPWVGGEAGDELGCPEHLVRARMSPHPSHPLLTHHRASLRWR